MLQVSHHKARNLRCSAALLGLLLSTNTVAIEPAADPTPQLGSVELATPAEQNTPNLVQRVELNLTSATPEWLGTPARAHYARFLVRHYQRRNALAELYALTAEQPSSHFKALFTKLSAYQVLSDAGYFCASLTSSQDHQQAAYLLWLRGDLKKPDWQLMEQASYACSNSPLQA